MSLTYTMHIIRRLLLILGLILFGISVVLLLNVTAPNPTHRRYSSRVPYITSERGKSQQMGEDGERVISADTGIVRNESSGQRFTFCKKAADVPTENGRCVAYYAALTPSFRRPDFLTDTLILESKNVKIMDEDDRDLLSQISDYSLVALTTRRALWIYTRVDTDVAEKYVRLAEATGGGLVRYFSVPGWIDPVDQSARGGLALSGGVVGLISLWEIVRNRRRMAAKRIQVTRTPRDTGTSQGSSVYPSAPKPDPRTPRSPRVPDPVGKATDAVNRAQDAVDQTRRKL